MSDHYSRATRGGVITVTETLARKLPCAKCWRPSAIVTADDITWVSKHGAETHSNVVTVDELLRVHISYASGKRLDELAGLIATERAARDKIRRERVL